jgi:hypothetical protein
VRQRDNAREEIADLRELLAEALHSFPYIDTDGRIRAALEE